MCTTRSSLSSRSPSSPARQSRAPITAPDEGLARLSALTLGSSNVWVARSLAVEYSCQVRDPPAKPAAAFRQHCTAICRAPPRRPSTALPPPVDSQAPPQGDGTRTSSTQSYEVLRCLRASSPVPRARPASSLQSVLRPPLRPMAPPGARFFP